MKRYYHYLSIFRGRPSSQETTSEAGVDTTTEADTTVEAEAEEDDVVSLVKSYIDSGACSSVTTGSSCGDSAESYYREFEYGGRRVVVANGIPDHEAEHDQFFVNPNTRCER